MVDKSLGVVLTIEKVDRNVLSAGRGTPQSPPVRRERAPLCVQILLSHENSQDTRSPGCRNMASCLID